ncbi:nitroreductase family protein [Cupriavidus basilensis]|uniref:Oxygen-insensitive NADPH nitroreductase n=1 Tax=Cupriavidus basilensis TaxID=68895 RepID=A0A0C4Y9Y3_9BURK|nr:nitroreductase family protein [Cupriavidus basilensis]AJG19733.1 Oxygen-insensitive NADPH nitroreductase [Cupriavidus basilensis]
MTHPIASSESGVEYLKLPVPQSEGGMSLLTALRQRCSTRRFAPRSLDDSLLSSLLWAAFGINRPEAGLRTAPSARNWQEIDLYLALRDGLYVLEAADWRLRLVSGEDLRAATGLQDYVAEAPLNLVYVSRLSMLDETDKSVRQFYTALDTGYISQNVYLFCAASGLATVARGLLDRRTLAAAMRLAPDQRVILAQSVGYPA